MHVEAFCDRVQYYGKCFRLGEIQSSSIAVAGCGIVSCVRLYQSYLSHRSNYTALLLIDLGHQRLYMLVLVEAYAGILP